MLVLLTSPCAFTPMWQRLRSRRARADRVPCMYSLRRHRAHHHGGEPGGGSAHAAHCQHPYDDILKQRVLYGTPEAVVDRLQEYQDALGITGVVLEMNYGDGCRMSASSLGTATHGKGRSKVQINMLLGLAELDMLENIKALTFDTGGTILDWHHGISHAFASAGTRRGLGRLATITNEYRRRSLQAMLNAEHPTFTIDDVHREMLDAVVAEFGLAGSHG